MSEKDAGDVLRDAADANRNIDPLTMSLALNLDVVAIIDGIIAGYSAVPCG